MQFIWDSLQKEPDGDHVRYSIDFIDFLWDYGFVDTNAHPRKTWRAAFDLYRQPDGTYFLNRQEFVALEKYRYRGEIRIPFDALRINEGQYTDEGFQELVDASIAPSVALGTEELQRLVQDLKTEFRQPNGLVLIRRPAKLKMKQWIDERPSPLRRLEIVFDQMLQEQGLVGKVEGQLEKREIAATPEQTAKIQASTFVQGPASLAEAQSLRLKGIAKARDHGTPGHASATTPLKKIGRSKKGLRG